MSSAVFLIDVNYRPAPSLLPHPLTYQTPPSKDMSATLKSWKERCHRDRCGFPGHPFEWFVSGLLDSFFQANSPVRAASPTVDAWKLWLFLLFFCFIYWCFGAFIYRTIERQESWGRKIANGIETRLWFEYYRSREPAALTHIISMYSIHSSDDCSCYDCWLLNHQP